MSKVKSSPQVELNAVRDVLARHRIGEEIRRLDVCCMIEEKTSSTEEFCMEFLATCRGLHIASVQEGRGNRVQQPT